MVDVAAPPRPALVVIPNVAILEVGDDWPMMTGACTVTPDDLQAAVDAMGDPAVRHPILKLGHGGLKAGMPAFGRLDNLRTENNGMTLVADIVGAPAWLADILPYAWPSRSIEGRANLTTETGRKHLLVIDALALLGVELPAISTLADVAAIYSAESMERANVTLAAGLAPRPPQQPARSVLSSAPMPQVRQLIAGVTTEDIRREYYETLPQGSWWWIREIQLDPLSLIVDDGDGTLYQVAVTISDAADMVFGEPQEVRVDYVPVPPDEPSDLAAARAGRVVFSTRQASTGGRMDPTELRRRLGLAEDATDDELNAALDRAAQPPAPTGDPTPPVPTSGTPAPAPAAPAPAPTPTAVSLPDGAIAIDRGQWEEVQRELAAGRADREQRAHEAENAFIARQRQAGRLGPATNPNSQRLEATLRREWQRSQGEAEAFAASLAEVVPVTERGHAAGSETSGDIDSRLLAMFPELASKEA